MRNFEREERSLRSRIADIDARFRLLQHTAATQGIDLRLEWDTLAQERIDVAKRLAAIADEGFLPSAGGLVLSACISLGCGVLYWRNMLNPRLMVAGFIAGFAVGTLRAARRRTQLGSCHYLSAFQAEL